MKVHNMLTFGKTTTDVKPSLTEAEKRMYAAESAMNFRWISQLLATHSTRVLGDDDLVDSETQAKLSDIISSVGQFAALVSAPLPMELLISMAPKLTQAEFPLEGYSSVLDLELVREYRGSAADLHCLVVYRPKTQQLVLSIAGSSTATHAAYDIAAIKHQHPSGHGMVHFGFWKIYEGVWKQGVEAIQQGFKDHPGRVKELVITGHSMGGAIAQLFTLDIMTGRILKVAIPEDVTLTLAIFSSPRMADPQLSLYWREQVKSYRERLGEHAFTEYFVKAYNDGVPTLPPKNLGWRHCTEQPLYLKYGRLFRIPASECENSAFTVETSHAQSTPSQGGISDVPPPPKEHPAPLAFRPSENPSDQQLSVKSSSTPGSPEPLAFPSLGLPIDVPKYPRGGHNYIFRDFESTMRRLKWLETARASGEGWEDRYLRKERRHSGRTDDGVILATRRALSNPRAVFLS
ncbi:Alpha/Beta hydrolase protein [Flagelloscypha sp. PMI_526]|nr:Alpha/Beta hydrolase protein [Flagelloscypha sp. PMI_526]